MLGKEQLGTFQLGSEENFFSFGQTQAKINAFNIQIYAQAQALILNFTAELGTVNSFGGNIIPGLGYAPIPSAHGNTRASIKQAYQAYSQAQSDINQTYQTYAQALATLNQFYIFGLANADIKQEYQKYSQAQALVTRTDTLLVIKDGVYSTERSGGWPNIPSPGMPNNSTWYVVSRFVADQTGSWQIRELADFQSTISINGSVVFSVNYSEATKTGSFSLTAGVEYNMVVFWNGDSAINGWTLEYQRPTDTGWHWFSDGSPPWLVRPTAYAQALAQINPPSIFGQAQAHINIIGYPPAQAQASILQVYQAYSQAQALLYHPIGLGQAKSSIISDIYASACTNLHVEIYGFTAPNTIMSGIPIDTGQTVSLTLYGAYKQFNGDSLWAIISAPGETDAWHPIFSTQIPNPPVTITGSYTVTETWANMTVRLYADASNGYMIWDNACWQVYFNKFHPAQTTALIDSPIKVLFGQAQARIGRGYGVGQAGALINTRFAFAQARSSISGISLVQSTVGGGGTRTLSSTPQPGNLLVAFYSSRSSSSGTTYSLDNGTWTLVDRGYAISGGGHAGEISYQIVPPGGLSATTNLSGAVGNTLFGIVEFSGINTSDPFDTSNVSNVVTGVGGTTSLTPERAETLLFSFVSNNRDAGNDFTPVSGMTELYDVEFGGLCPQVEVNYQILPMASGSSYSVGFTNFINDNSFVIGVAFTGRAHIGVAQAQAFIGQLERSYGQAQATILILANAYGQALTFIGHFQSGQAQADIKATSNSFGQSLAYIGHYQFSQAQAKINSFDQPHFAQALALIYHPIGLANVQSWIKQTYNVFANAQGFILPTTGKGQAQAWIKQTYPLMSLDVNYALLTMGATASDSIGSSVLTDPNYTIDGNDYGFRWSLVGIAQDQYLQINFNQQRTINYYRVLPTNYDATLALQIFTDTWVTVATLPQFNVGIFDDVDTSKVVTGEIGPYTTPAIRLAVIDDGSNNGIAIATVEIGFATVKSPTFAQAAALLGRFGVAQTQARVSPGRGIAAGQAKADIVETFNHRGQANAWVIKPQVYGQANVDILQQYWAFAQVPFWIIPPTVIAQALATIKAYDVEGFGQANADIEQAYNRVANAKAFIAKAIGHAQAQAQLKTSRRIVYGQARARIGNYQHGYARAYIIKAQVYAQAKTSIKDTKQRYAQTRAVIIRHEGYGNAKTLIKQEYVYSANAGAIMNQTFGLGQARTWIETTYRNFGQANTDIKNIATNYSNPYGQSQAVVHIRYYVNAQALSWISPRHFALGNAQAFINNFRIGQAQAQLLSFDYPRHAQAQGYILASSVIISTIPTSNLHTYLVRYNNYDLPGYAQNESYNSGMRLTSHMAKSMDGSLSEYLGLTNKEIVITMKTWESTYTLVKDRVQEAAAILRSFKGNFANLYLQQPDAHFLAMVQRIEVSKSVGGSVRTLDYRITFEAKPWLISNDIYEISGTGLIDTGTRTIFDGGWTPTKILVSGTDVEITAYTESGDPAGFLSIDGECTDLVIDSETFTATENGINRNDLLATKNYSIYVGPGKTFFQINGATSCVIQYQNRWYLSSTRRRSTQAIATTIFPLLIVQVNTGLALALISSIARQGYAQSRAVITESTKRRMGQSQAMLYSPIIRAYAQARAQLRNGRTLIYAQAQSSIRVLGTEGVGQVRVVIEGPTKYKSAQARALIKQHKRLSTGQARARIQGVPVAPSSFTATPGDGEITLTWV